MGFYKTCFNGNKLETDIKNSILYRKKLNKHSDYRIKWFLFKCKLLDIVVVEEKENCYKVTEKWVWWNPIVLVLLLLEVIMTIIKCLYDMVVIIFDKMGGILNTNHTYTISKEYVYFNG